MVSMFEESRFRDFARSVHSETQVLLRATLEALYYGDEAEGLEALVELLAEYKLAKWPLVTVVNAYLKADTDLLVKPTTT